MITDYSQIEPPIQLKAGRIQLGPNRYIQNFVDCKITDEGDLLAIKSGFSREVIASLKAMDTARWDPDRRLWTVKNNRRNWFQLAYMAGIDVYNWYDKPLIDIEFQPRKHGSGELLMPYKHQQGMVRHGLTYHFGIWASQQGTGKSLSAIMLMELTGFTDEECWYVGPRSAQTSFQLELEVWHSRVKPVSLTYEGLVKLLSNWPQGKVPPKFVFFDESSRLKSPTAKRSQAAFHLAEAMRDAWGESCYIILGSGTPAPKSPADFWWQCEIALPGFIKEGTIAKFKARLGLMVMKEAIATGGQYPHLVTWKDDENKCGFCGQLKSHDVHTKPPGSGDAAFDDLVGEKKIDIETYHPFQKGVNEVANLYKRMKGLTIVNFKKDCLSELPEKRFRVIECKPTRETLNAAKLIVATAKTVVSGMVLLRELSDGFQYAETENGMVKCHRCQGNRFIQAHVPIVEEEEIAVEMDRLIRKAAEQYGGNVDTLLAEDDPRFDATGMPIPEYVLFPSKYELQDVACPICDAEGEVMSYTTETIQVPCPKVDVVKSALDEHDDDGRIVMYAGFKGSIDRLVSVCQDLSWEWIRVDGRGWHTSIKGLRSPVEMVRAFQQGQKTYENVAFIGHPASAGMGLTLTASWEELFYSNDFNAESRLQALDRIHRPGMDVNKGALITDIVHLPSDRKILDNLDKKIRLQDLAMGDFKTAMNAALNDVARSV